MIQSWAGETGSRLKHFERAHATRAFASADSETSQRSIMTAVEAVVIFCHVELPMLLIFIWSPAGSDIPPTKFLVGIFLLWSYNVFFWWSLLEYTCIYTVYVDITAVSVYNCFWSGSQGFLLSNQRNSPLRCKMSSLARKLQEKRRKRREAKEAEAKAETRSWMLCKSTIVTGIQ